MSNLWRLREEVSQFKERHMDQFQKLDMVEKSIVDAIIKQKDVFVALHNAQSQMMLQLHDSIQATIEQELEKTHELIIRESQKKFQGISEAQRRRIMKTK
jgi:hypothetical protein